MLHGSQAVDQVQTAAFKSYQRRVLVVDDPILDAGQIDLIDPDFSLPPIIYIPHEIQILSGPPTEKLVGSAPHRVPAVVFVEVGGKIFDVFRQLGRIPQKISHRRILEEIYRIIVMARQDRDASKLAFIKKIRLLGDEADRVLVEKLCVYDGVVINPQKKGIDKKALDRLDAEKDVFSRQRPAVLKVNVAANLEGVDQFVLRNGRARLGDQGPQLQGARIAGKQAFED